MVLAKSGEREQYLVRNNDKVVRESKLTCVSLDDTMSSIAFTRGELISMTPEGSNDAMLSRYSASLYFPEAGLHSADRSSRGTVRFISIQVGLGCFT